MRWRVKYTEDDQGVVSHHWHDFRATALHGAKIKATWHMRRKGYRPNDRVWFRSEDACGSIHFRNFGCTRRRPRVNPTVVLMFMGDL